MEKISDAVNSLVKVNSRLKLDSELRNFPLLPDEIVYIGIAWNNKEEVVRDVEDEKVVIV